MESSESSSSSGRGKHSVPKETAQMNVLGRDGRDLELSMSSHTTPPTSSRAKLVAASQQLPWRPPTASSMDGEGGSDSNKSSSWWDGITTTASRWTMSNKPQPASSPRAAQDALEAAYASFDDESLASTLTPQPVDAASEEDRFVGDLPKKHRRTSSLKKYGRKTSPSTASLLQPQLEEGVEFDSTQEQTFMSPEDKLRKDCSFFYRDMDDLPRRGSRRFSSRLQLDPSREAFRARYDQLNAKHVANDDLELYEDDDEPKQQSDNNDFSLLVSPQFPRVADFSNSSLYYRQDGKVLMRLPQDNVKLVMDPHLEAGILSMEYCPYDNDEPWRKRDLRYVLTVNEDLYRRVVKEMADSYKTPCGLYYCCQESSESSGHVHIWVAIALLFCVLVFLAVNTIIWPLD